nr:FAD:protein FMN transferase [uncultured Caproiciproducens sp.]
MNKNKKTVVLLITLLTIIIICLIFIWVKYGQRAKSYECTNFAMGTYIQQTVYGKNAQVAATAAAKKIGELENLISWRITDSDIYKLNQASGSDWIKLDARTIALLQKSLDVAQKSNGAFEPTILPITSLWDFGGSNQHVPAKNDITKYLKYVNYNDLRVNTKDSTASLKQHYMAVDLGAIGKGAACDEAVASYRQSGADCGIVSVGGSVGVFGTKSDKSAWHVAVRDPRSSETQSASMGTIDLHSGFVSTSGTYEKTFTENGVTYHHLLNPKTGYPENNGLISVTVICDNGALSDALSTACFVLGREKGIALLKEYNANGIFIDSDSKVFATDNIINSFKIVNKQYTLNNDGVK